MVVVTSYIVDQSSTSHFLTDQIISDVGVNKNRERDICNQIIDPPRTTVGDKTRGVK